MKYYYIFLIIFVFHSFLYSQIDSTNIVDEKIFQLLEDASEDLEDAVFFEIIEELSQNPIDINRASSSELLKLPFLSPTDAKLIISKRNKLGRFSSFEELKEIEGIDESCLILIKPFIEFGSYSVSEDIVNNDLNYYFRSRAKSDLQNRQGFNNGYYQGSKLSFYNRMIAKSNNFKVGILSEKDPGEINFSDHYTGYIQYQSAKLLQNIVFGDYNIEFGEGLALWSPYSFSKGSDAVNPPIKRMRSIRPHLSSEENRHFRGSAVSINFNSSTFTGFYSTNNISATLDDNSNITNFYQIGYYRSESEKSKKNNLRENVYGFTYGIDLNENLNFGILHYEVNYDKSFLFKNSNELSGDKFSFSSVSARILLNKLSISSEIANNTEAFSILTNILLRISPQIDVLASYRNYAPNYYNIFSNGFGEFGHTQNEIGYYLGAKIRSRYGNLNIYYDIFKSPSLSYYSDFPASGNDFLIQYDSKLTKSLQFTVKYKREKKEKQILIDGENKIGDQLKSNLRAEIKFKINKEFTGKSRIEIVQFTKSSNAESGFISYQDIKYKIPKYFSFSGRIVFFDTESYNSRLYEFENDLKGSMSNLPLFGEGFRWYFLVNFNPIQQLTISLKYAETFKPKEDFISSGNSQITGSLDNRISLQIDCKL